MSFGISSLVSGLVSPITNLIQKRNDNKTAIKKATIESIKSAKDHDAAWELVQAQNETSTWKDEYITIVITLPVILVFLATLYSAFTGDNTVINAVNEAMNALQLLIPDYGTILKLVCLAAVGIKGVKSLVK